MVNINTLALPIGEFLVDAAIAHFDKTGNSVHGFIIPKATWEQLRLEPDVNETDVAYMLEIEGFCVIYSKDLEPMIIEDGNPKGIPLL